MAEQETYLNLQDISESIHIAYEKFDSTIVDISIPPEYHFAEQILLLASKAIHAYNTRPDGKEYGIAFDLFFTVFIADPKVIPCGMAKKPIVNIFFNLSSGYVNLTKGK